MGVNQHGWRSIVVRVMAVVVLAGLAGGGIAIYVATRAMSDIAEVKLVETTATETDRARLAITGRLEVAEAQLTAAALLADAGRFQDVPSALSAFIRAARVRRTSEVVELVRDEGDRWLISNAGGHAVGRWLIDGNVAIRVDVGETSAIGVVEVASLLPRGPGTIARLEARTDPRLEVAGVIITRDEDTAIANASVEHGLAIHQESSLAGAREEVWSAMRRTVGWTAAITLVVVFALAVMLARRVTRPIRALAAAVRKGHGGFAPPRLRSDEIGELGTAIAAMHEDLANDARQLAVGADFAREVVRIQEPSEVIRQLETALAVAHPAQGWRVRIGDEEQLVGAAMETSQPVPVITQADDRIVLRLELDDQCLGVAVGTAPATEAELKGVEVLCHTAIAAIRAIGLSRAALTNEKLALLGRISAGVAHEINNPLAYVTLNLGILEDEITDPGQRELLRETLEGTDRVAKIVKDLSRLTRGSSEALGRENLADVVAEQIKIARTRARGAALVFDAEGPVWVNCTRTRLGQALLNLLVNALDAVAARDHGRVTVSVTSRAGFGVVTIRDNGPGIPATVRRHLFDAFFTTKGEQGTGLGLYLSRQFVHLQGGHLDVVRSGPDGTEFEIRVPSTEGPAALVANDPVARATSESESNRKRVLIIDDEPQIVRTLERWLSQYADVVTARGGSEGLERFRDGPFSLVLCDWNMPGMSGHDFVGAVRATAPDALRSVVIMTGGSTTEITGLRVIAKPLDRELIKEILGV